MRRTVLGIALVAGLAALAMGAMPAHPQVAPEGTIPGQIAAADDQMIVVSSVVEDRYRQVVIVDPRQKAVLVYHVELTTGVVELVGARNFTWDLQLKSYNGKKPLPAEIQSLLEHR